MLDLREVREGWAKALSECFADRIISLGQNKHAAVVCKFWRLQIMRISLIQLKGEMAVSN